MLNLLYVDACPRKEGISRTRALAKAFQAALDAHDDIRWMTHTVPDMGLAAIDGESLDRREALIDARAWQDAMFAPARDFQRADGILIAAPYWDLMFPAMLKVYIEHVFVRELTFCYRDDRPIGLCGAGRAVFLTTAGSPVGAYDFGTDYLRAAFGMLGIPRLDCVAAEGLDMQGAQVVEIMGRAEAQARQLAEEWYRDLKTWKEESYV